MKTITCRFCGKVLNTRTANNAYPYKGYCCYECNMKEVIPARIEMMKKERIYYDKDC